MSDLSKVTRFVTESFSEFTITTEGDDIRVDRMGVSQLWSQKFVDAAEISSVVVGEPVCGYTTDGDFFTTSRVTHVM